MCVYLLVYYISAYFLMHEYGTYKFYVILLSHGKNGYANAPQC